MVIKKIWPILRLLVFLAAGLACTVCINPDEVGTWKNFLGYLLLTLAVFDIFILLVIPQFKKPKSDRIL